MYFTIHPWDYIKYVVESDILMMKTGGLGGGAPQKKNCSSIEKIIRISISKTCFWRGGILREIFKTPFLEGGVFLRGGIHSEFW